MATKKQIEANRLNSKKSTGPRTPEGKARSSRNALRSGIDAKSQVIRGESPAALEALKAEYSGRFQPTTPEQRTLVDTLIDCEWILRRLRTCEAQLWDIDVAGSRVPLSATFMAETYRRYAETQARLQRRIDMTQRNYRHALLELERLQAAEPAAPEPQPVPASPTDATAKSDIGFVPPGDYVMSPPAPSGRSHSSSSRATPVGFLCPGR